MEKNQKENQKEEVIIKEKNYSIKKILQSPIQLIFLIFAILTLICVIPFTWQCYIFIEKAKKNVPQGYQYPNLYDFKITAVSSIFFALAQILMRQYFYNIFVPFCKEQNNLKEREIRSGKGALCIYKTIYFAQATFWGYYVLKDQNYFPKSLLGNGEFLNSFQGFPYTIHAPYLKEYFLITMGYHVGGLITHFFGTRRNDFVEMGLHHILSLYLYGGAYLYNFLEIGCVIAFLHDTADITTNIVKALAETKLKIPTAVVFVIHMCIWFYTRNFLLPIYIYQIFTYEKKDLDFGSPIILPFFCFMLSCMFVLHSFWFYLFCKHLRKFVNTGSTEDEQNKTEIKIKVKSQ